MGKTKKAKKAGGESKAALKAAKAAKAAKKSDSKAKKAVKKGKSKDAEVVYDEDDLIKTLEEYRKQWEEDHKVVEDVIEVFLACCRGLKQLMAPNEQHLWMFGGEFFDGSTVQMYADMYRYSTDKQEWRRFTSPNSPGPRCAHQVVASPAGGGRLWLFGGEFSAPNQTSFHHYRDLWCFHVESHVWERFDTKIRPSARSGHRMCLWKQFVFLFGGFQDTGIRTTYLSDLWIWDLNEYRWHEIRIPEVDRKPAARSGFSFLPCADGVILHGGYTKIYEGKRTIGKALDDTWLLRVPPANEEGVIDFQKFKWEKRKKVGYAPSPRSGCTMALWQAKSMGILFGGVFDDDRDEENMESTFYNDLFGYNMAGNGRWISLPLKKRKKPGAKKKRKAVPVAPKPVVDEEERGSDEDDEDMTEAEREGGNGQDSHMHDGYESEEDPDDPEKTVPMARYNSMLAVVKNTLYIYGGILEADAREFTLDDFHYIQLDKLDRYHCLRESMIDNDWKGSDSENDSSSSDDDEDGSGGSDDEEGEDAEDDNGLAPVDGMAVDSEAALQQLTLANDATEADIAKVEAERERIEKEALRKQAQAFMGVSMSTERTAEDIISTPQPGETMAAFFERSKVYWSQKAYEETGNRGKELRRDGFGLAQEAYKKYQPLLEEIQRIQEEAGLEAGEMSRGARAGLGTDSRNRR